MKANLEEIYKAKLNEVEFEIQIVRKSKIRNIHLRIPGINKLKISCPHRTTGNDINKAIKAHLEWIISNNNKLRLTRKEFNFIHGEKHYFNGQELPINIIYVDKKRSKLIPKDDCLEFYMNQDLSHQQLKREIQKLLNQFYKTKTLEFCLAELKKLQSIYYLDFKDIRIKKLKTRWGSCSRDKNLNFNQDLAKLPADIRNYVVAHEYSHLKHLNHSEKFWNLVIFFDHDCRKHRSWLRKNEKQFSHHF